MREVPGSTPGQALEVERKFLIKKLNFFVLACAAFFLNLYMCVCIYVYIKINVGVESTLA